MNSFSRDVRHALRILAKNPGFAAVVIVTLALGIGANTAIFSVLEAVLLRPLPYPRAAALVTAQTIQQADRQPWGSCPPDFKVFRNRNRSFERLASFYVGPRNLSGSHEPERLPVLIVSSNFFATLGRAPVLGRDLTADDEKWGFHRVALLSDGLWRRRFGADQAILGKVIHLNSEPFSIVGVLPPEFQFSGINAELFVPMSFAPGDNLNTRNNYFLTMVGRLRSGISRTQAETDLNALMEQIIREHPENKGLGVGVTPLRDTVVGGVRSVLLVLMAAVGFVLLIACANVANLLLARALGRQREIAIRSALGASARRLVQQLITEGLVLGVLGGGAGVLLASWALQAVRGLSPQVLPRASEIQMDAGVLAFSFGVSVLAGVLFGLAPALHAARNRADALGQGSRSTGLAGGRRGLREALITCEIALSLVLLIGAGLLLTSVQRLLRVDPGFDPRGALTAEIDLPSQKYVDRQLELSFSPRAYRRAAEFFDSAIGRLRALPGVRAVGGVSGLPLSGENWGKVVTFYDRPLPQNVRDLPPIQYRVVAGDYFRASGIRLQRGRAFTDGDTLEAPFVAIVNAELVRRYWNGQNPIGKVLSVNPPRELVPEGTLPPDYVGPEKFTVVGVADDVHYGRLDRPAVPLVYVPYRQGAEGQMTLFLVLRSDGDPLALAAPIREQIRRIDPDQPVVRMATLATRISNATAQPRLQAILLGAFAALALLLTSVGLYGVISYSVSQGTREIGIRMALGALRRDVTSIVLAQAMRLTAAGLGLGLAGALALTRLMRGLLFGVSATDPLVFGAVAGLLAGVSLLASFAPARRAARLDPMAALRTE